MHFDVTHLVPDADDGYVPAIDADEVYEREAVAVDYEARPHIWYIVPEFNVVTDGLVIQHVGEWLQVYTMGIWDNPENYRRVHVTDVVEARANRREPLAVERWVVGENGYYEIREVA
jgi:hypothetical protein